MGMGGRRGCVGRAERSEFQDFRNFRNLTAGGGYLGGGVGGNGWEGLREWGKVGFVGGREVYNFHKFD